MLDANLLVAPGGWWCAGWWSSLHVSIGWTVGWRECYRGALLCVWFLCPSRGTVVVEPLPVFRYGNFLRSCDFDNVPWPRVSLGKFGQNGSALALQTSFPSQKELMWGFNFLSVSGLTDRLGYFGGRDGIMTWQSFLMRFCAASQIVGMGLCCTSMLEKGENTQCFPGNLWCLRIRLTGSSPFWTLKFLVCGMTITGPTFGLSEFL